MQTLSKTQIEAVATQVAAILKDRVDGDPFDPATWTDAGRGICVHRHETVTGGEDGSCITFDRGEFSSPFVFVYTETDPARPWHAARAMIHEYAHSCLRHFAPEMWGDVGLMSVDYAQQAHENICRAVERIILGDFGRGWLPLHGSHWH